MAVLRVRDLVYLARNGVTVDVAGWGYPLSTFYAETTPVEWIPQSVEVPPLDSLDLWRPNAYEIDRVAAQRIADKYNASKPWESGGGS
ncbi:hypothetical protein [Sphaerisporangium sp. NPDC051011]|uniref:hypothetical protein n=1 Tax=Sphaerisporangium sp. NPDC051011 TaxID=3155792 RepID=UPI0033C6905E